MTDAIAKRVWGQLLETELRQAYAFGAMNDVGPAVGFGDTLEIPEMATPTNRSSTSRTAPETIDPSVSTLSIDQETHFNVNLPKLSTIQRMDGRWESATAMHMMRAAANLKDNNLCDYLDLSLCWTTAASYVDNVAGDALTEDDLAASEAAIKAIDGVDPDNLLYIISSYAEGSVKTISNYVPGFMNAERGMFGSLPVASINGIPVIVTNAVNRNHTVSASASAIASNVLTCTVPSGHGLQVGELITTSGGTADITTAAAITSVTATTVVAPLTSANDASNGALTISTTTSRNLLVDRSAVFVATQQFPDIEMRKDFESPASALQFYESYGRIGIAGRARLLLSPGSSV